MPHKLKHTSKWFRATVSCNSREHVILASRHNQYEQKHYIQGLAV